MDEELLDELYEELLLDEELLDELMICFEESQDELIYGDKKIVYKDNKLICRNCRTDSFYILRKDNENIDFDNNTISFTAYIECEDCGVIERKHIKSTIDFVR